MFWKRKHKKPIAVENQSHVSVENQRHVAVVDNRNSADSFIHNRTKSQVTVACNQQQAGKFSVNLMPGEKSRVNWGITAQPYFYGKQKYDEFSYRIGSSETWEVHLKASKLIMNKVV